MAIYDISHIDGYNLAFEIYQYGDVYNGICYIANVDNLQSIFEDYIQLMVNYGYLLNIILYK